MPTDPVHQLPERANIDFLKRVAKDLLREARHGDTAAIARIGQTDREPKLADAQRALAHEYGHRSWTELRNAINAQQPGSVVRRAPRTAKHAQVSTFTAAGFMAAAQAGGWRAERLPDTLLFVFQTAIARQLETDTSFTETPSLAPGNARVFLSNDRTPVIGVSCLSPGTTTMISQLENQVALNGAHQFVVFNIAGGIGPDIEPGDISIIATAVRDDDISDHYLPPGDTVNADPELTQRILDALTDTFPTCELRTAWTNPAVYRQTEAELNHYASNGVALVESETAALFAVAQAVGAKAAAVLIPIGVWRDGQTIQPTNPSEVALVHRQGFQALLDALAPKN